MDESMMLIGQSLLWMMTHFNLWVNSSPHQPRLLVLNHLSILYIGLLDYYLTFASMRRSTLINPTLTVYCCFPCSWMRLNKTKHDICRRHLMNWLIKKLISRITDTDVKHISCLRLAAFQWKHLNFHFAPDSTQETAVKQEMCVLEIFG